MHFYLEANLLKAQGPRMSYPITHLCCTLAAIATFAFAPSAVAKPKATTSVSIKRQIEPKCPSWAYTHGISSGYAKIAFYVDEHGKASEFFPIEYSHQVFADELMATILKWDFVPARKNKIPVKSVCHAYWDFLPDRPIETNALFDTGKRISGTTGKDYRELEFHEDNELDQRIAMTSFPGLAIPNGSGILSEGQETVRARINFFVDQGGHVRLPHIIDSSDPEANTYLEAAFKNAVFSLPTHKDETTIALIERTYDFPVVWVDQEPDKPRSKPTAAKPANG